MPPDRWLEIKTIFGAVIEAAPGRRAAMLAERCGQDEELRRDLQKLLADWERAGSFLESPPKGPGSAEARFAEGTRLAGRYRISRCVGSGGMGEVYEAEDESLQERVALKTLRRDRLDDARAVSRFRREALLIRRVGHPNVCRIFDAVESTGNEGEPVQAFTMEFLDGPTLAEYLRGRAPLETAEALELLEQMAGALSAAHQAGVIHRDFKPSNMILTRRADGGRRLVVTDFGLAFPTVQLAETFSATSTGRVMGTPEYMSPEQLRGLEVTSRSDIYSLGVVLFEMMTGERPSGGAGGLEEVVRRCLEPAPEARSLRADLDSNWNAAIGRCLARSPEDRFGTADAVVEAVRRGPGWRDALQPVWRGARVHRREAIFVAGAMSLSPLILREWKQQRVTGSGPLNLLVAPAEGTPGPPVEAVTLQLRKTLDQSRQIELWDQRKLGAVLARMGKAGNAKLASADWREVAYREGVRLVLFTSVSNVSDGLTLALRLEQVEGRPDRAWRHWQESFNASSVDGLFEAIDVGSRWVRDTSGESRDQVAATSAPPREVTTPSWRALAEFTRAEELAAGGKREEAVLALEAAIREDAEFTMAWMRKGDLLMSQGASNRAFETWEAALTLLSKRPISRREDLRFRAMFMTDVCEDAAAEKLYWEYIKEFPSDWHGYFFRSYPLLRLGRPDEALAMLDRCRDVPERTASRLIHCYWNELYASPARAEQYRSDLKERGFAMLAEWAEASGAYCQGATARTVEALGRASKLTGEPEQKSWFEFLEACALADGGLMEEAERVLAAGAERDAQLGIHSWRARKLSSLAWLRLARNDRPGARSAALAALDVELTGHTAAQSVAVLARSGMVTEAGQCAARFSAQLPYAIFRQPLHRVRAEVAIAKGNVEEGLRDAQAAAALDIAATGKEYLAYALAACGRGKEASGEYRAAERFAAFQFRTIYTEPAGHLSRCRRGQGERNGKEGSIKQSG